jgi:peptidyl-prolyl cis-trans isomerase D
LKDTDIDLGTVAKSGIIDPTVADAAFALKEGEVSAPVQGRFGAVLVTVLKIEPKETKPLAVLAPFIRNDIALKRAQTMAQDMHDKIEDARAGGSTLEEAAQKFHLPLVTYDAVDRSGHDPAGKAINLPDAARVIGAAFASDVGVDNDPIEIAGGYIWYDVAGITPAHDRTLAEVKTEVERRWRDDQTADRLKSKAKELLDKLTNGNPFDAVATAAGVKVETAADLKRGVANPGIPAKVIDAAFHTATDKFGSSDGVQPTQWFVFRVSEVKTPKLDPNSPDGKKLVQLLQQQMSEDIFSQYVLWLENYLGTTINQSVLAQAVGAPTPDAD